MQFNRCGFEGFGSVVEQDPRVEVHRDVLFVPGGNGGLFDRGRRLISGSGYYRGLRSEMGIISLVHGSIFSPIDPDTVHEWHDETLFFGGVLIDHYGHYLLGTLPRFWLPYYEEDCKQLVINTGSLDGFFRIEHVKETLAILGLRQENFCSFDRPIRLRKVIVPFPSFEENNLAHKVFGRVCAKIGADLSYQTLSSMHGGPTYLSKSRLQQGITKVENEEDICNTLAKNGVEIVFPETLSLSEQVNLFKRSEILLGFAGSTFHTALFSGCSKMLIFNHHHHIHSNQLMIDCVSNNNARYLYSEAGITHVGAGDNFHSLYRVDDPEAWAEAMLREMDDIL